MPYGFVSLSQRSCIPLFTLLYPSFHALVSLFQRSRLAYLIHPFFLSGVLCLCRRCCAPECVLLSVAAFPAAEKRAGEGWNVKKTNKRGWLAAL